MPVLKKCHLTNPDNFLKMPVHGFNGWREQTFFEGRNKDGSHRTVEGYKNVLTDEEYTPPNGWNDPPPGPTGDLAFVRHCCGGSDELWENLKKAPILAKEVIEARNRTIYRY